METTGRLRGGVAHVHEHVTLDQAVGRNLRRWRQLIGATHDELVAAARAGGLNLSQSKISLIENGHRGVQLVELIGLPAVLTGLLEQKGAHARCGVARVTVADLLVGPPSTTVDPGDLAQLTRWLRPAIGPPTFTGSDSDVALAALWRTLDDAAQGAALDQWYRHEEVDGGDGR